MTLNAIIFDLDGTLADTLDGIAASMNRVLERLGLPTHPREAYRRFIGDGVHKLVERALPDDQRRRVDEVVGLYLPELTERGGSMARLYDGVVDALDAAADRSIPMSVLSNKPHDATVDVVRRLMGLDRFVEVRGQIDGQNVKPDPGVALAMAERIGVEPRSVACLGDSDVDMKLAANAGFIPLGAGWGIRGEAELRANGATRVLDRPTDLIPLLD